MVQSNFIYTISELVSYFFFSESRIQEKCVIITFICSLYLNVQMRKMQAEVIHSKKKKQVVLSHHRKCITKTLFLFFHVEPWFPPNFGWTLFPCTVTLGLFCLALGPNFSNLFCDSSNCEPCYTDKSEMNWISSPYSALIPRVKHGRSFYCSRLLA